MKPIKTFVFCLIFFLSCSLPVSSMEDTGWDIFVALQEARNLAALEEGRYQGTPDEDELEEESCVCAHCPEWLAFLVSFCGDCTDVGSLLPSSSYLAQKITVCIPHWNQDHAYPDGRFILEVGPGTGVFTKEILAKMGRNDRLVLVEFNEKFYRILLRKFGQDPRITIYHCSILNFQTSFQIPNHFYHYIISGLPFNNFSAKDVAAILTLYKNLLISGGSLAYFEYRVLPMLKLFGLTIAAYFFESAQKKLEDYRHTLDHLQNFRRCFARVDDSETIYRNVPWARVITCYQPNHFD